MDHASHKRLVHQGFAAVAAAPDDDALEAALGALYAPDAECSLFHPLHAATGREALAAALWRPMKRAFPDLSRADTLVAAGAYDGRDLVACMGAYVGMFKRDWLGLPASHKATWIRFAEVHALEGRRIIRSWILIDLLDLMRQAGVWPIAPSLGAEGLWPAPAVGGPAVDGHDPLRGAESLAQVLAMHASLAAFDGRSVASMDHARYWTPNFMWYGPAGIGTTRGLEGFRAHHQVPFLTAFPDRRGGQHYVRIGDGPFVVTGGWPSVTATHTGDGFLGLPATGKRVGMRVMDFYRCEAEGIAENWVPIDILDLLHQMGVDVLARLRHLRGDPRTDLATAGDGGPR